MRESLFSLNQAYSKLLGLTFRKSFRFWAVLISSLAFLFAVGAYYVTAYLRFRFTVYDADALYLPMLYDDIVNGVDLAGWSTSSVPYVFPDALLLFLLRTLFTNVHVALAVFGAVQILLFAGGLILLAKQLFESFRLEHYVLILLAGSLFFACLIWLHGYVQMFAVSVYHFGVIVVMPYVFALAVAFLRPSPSQSNKRRWFYVGALLVLLSLILMSDLFAAIQICAPLIGATVALGLLRKVRVKRVLIVLGVVAASAGMGYSLVQMVPVFRASFTYYSGTTGYTLTRSLSDFEVAIKNLLLNYPLHMVLLLAFVALCAVVVIFETAAFIRYRRTKHNTIVFLAVAFLTIFLLNPSSVMITSIFKSDAGFRYLLPLLFLPAFWCWPLLLEFFASPSVMRVFAIAGLIPLAILTVSNGLLITEQISKARLDDYYPDRVRCIDEVASQQGVKSGLAGYWQAKPLSALSKQHLQVVQVYDDLTPYLWVNNSNWYDLEPEFVVIDTQLNDIDPKRLEDRFGPPASIFHCQQLDAWVYNRPTDQLFRQQLKSSPFLARLEKIGDSVEFYAALLPSQIGKKVGLSRKVEGKTRGFLTFGPYIHLPAGYYRLEIAYEIAGAQDNVGRWDIISNTQVLESGPLPHAGKVFQHSFHLATPGTVEIRTFYEGKGQLTIEKIRLSRIG